MIKTEDDLEMALLERNPWIFIDWRDVRLPPQHPAHQPGPDGIDKWGHGPEGRIAMALRQLYAFPSAPSAKETAIRALQEARTLGWID